VETDRPMNMRLDLAPEERTELKELLRGASLHQLLGRWAEFVRGVERGYDDSIYEYTNDLSVRDSLEELISASSSTLAAKLRGEFAPIDERFTNATEPAKRPLSHAYGDLPSWWRRVPKRREGELAEDLKAMGHVE
jgi:hypothetical protein